MAAITTRDARPNARRHASRLSLPAPLVRTAAVRLARVEAVRSLSLHRAIAGAWDTASVAAVAAELPAYFLDQVAAGVEASTVSRSLTLLHDDITRRLLTLAMQEYGRPGVDFAWLALGSAARGELTLASDQDNALAYAGEADPSIDAHLARIAEFVTAGLRTCGFADDGSGVTAADARWRMPLDAWTGRLARCLELPNESHIMGASIAFDFRRVAGHLAVAGPLSRIVRDAPKHPAFLAGMGDTVREVRSPLRFPHRLSGRVDLKRSGLLAVANLARYLALSHGLTATGTLDRLAAVERLGSRDPESMQSLRSSFELIADLRMRHHAELLLAGRPLDDHLCTADLPRIVRAALREALCIVAESQRLLPPVLHGWG